MTTNNGHLDKDLTVTDKLSADLKALSNPRLSVPPEVDQMIINRAHRHFARRRPYRVLRWAGWAAAAAAVIIVIYSVEQPKRSGPALDVASLAANRLDIDHSGRVDILDAFKLARHIESADSIQKEWDVTGDGMVNRKDVDLIASAAVRLDKGA